MSYPTPAPRVAALVLAAGRSQRMGAVNKLLVAVGGTPMVARVVAAAAASLAQGIFVVTGHDRRAIEEALPGSSVQFVYNPDHELGLSTSLRRGLQALPANVEGVLVCLADMPWIEAAHLNRLVSAFAPETGRTLCVPTYQGRRGNPVLIDRRFFPTLLKELQGDTGARLLMHRYPREVQEVMMPDAAVLLDIDSPTELREGQRQGQANPVLRPIR